MVCQECKERQATLHFTKIINGQKHEMHLCDQCAREKGESIPGTDSFSIHHLFSGLFNMGAEQAMETAEQKQKCPNCGMSYEKFLHIGRFGCAHCYKAFGPQLSSVFKRVHAGNDTHKGKIPKRIGKSLKIEKRLLELKALLDRHIQKEEFEKAAELRDEIKKLKEQMEGGE